MSMHALARGSEYWSHAQDTKDTHQWVPATEHTEPVEGRPQGLVCMAGRAEGPGTEEQVAVVHWVILICLRSCSNSNGSLQFSGIMF